MDVTSFLCRFTSEVMRDNGFEYVMFFRLYHKTKNTFLNNSNTIVNKTKIYFVVVLLSSIFVELNVYNHGLFFKF
jgi:hypothetical protein